MNVYDQMHYLELANQVEGRDLSWKEKVAVIGQEFLKETQIECPVTHAFVDGNYIRTMRIPKGTLFIGRPHKRGHLCRLDAGSLVQFTDEGQIERHPGDSLRTVPGYQVVLYALTDVIGSTVHPDSGERDIEKLEDAIFDSKESFMELGMQVRKALENHA